MPPTETDWELIQADPEASVYAAAVTTRPELVEVINSGDVTVFVPTNAATEAEPSWNAIVADDAAFDEFVRSHIISGAVTVEQLFTGTTPSQVPTIGGATLTVDPVARTINGARIVTPDAHGTNGYVHTIDQLLVVPPVTPTTAAAHHDAPPGEPDHLSDAMCATGGTKRVGELRRRPNT